jgi:hypothetical protein
MKKLFVFIAISLLNFWWIWGTFVYAATGDTQPTEVIVTEKIPGLDCPCVAGVDCTKLETKKYKCTIQPGFESVQMLLAGFIKYATFIVALLWVLALVYSGIEMSMSGLWGKKDEAKKRIEKIIMWLVLLFLVGFILNTVAPWIYQ